MTVWLAAFLLSFGVIFVAELGDKSQLMALAFASRYPAWPVLIGITVATSVVHAVSVAVGHGLGVALPTGWLALAAGVAFLSFGAWTLRGDSLNSAESARAARSTGSVVLAASGAFLLAELGDKTMLATITLAAQHGWFATWLGSTLGMVVADALAIGVGVMLGRRLPEKQIRYGASGLFVLFGGWLLLEAVGQFAGASTWSGVAAALDHQVAGRIALGLALASTLLEVLASVLALILGSLTAFAPLWLVQGLAGAVTAVPMAAMIGGLTVAGLVVFCCSPGAGWLRPADRRAGPAAGGRAPRVEDHPRVARAVVQSRA